MIKKFTEEQYQKIVDIVNKYPNFGKQYIIPNGGEGEWSTTYKELIKGIFGSTNTSEKNSLEVQYMLALANPSTRELVYDKFVEKEKKYYWTSKKLDNHGAHAQIYKTRDGMLLNIYVPATSEQYYEKDVAYALTESEIREWGFNPDMFDREEIK